MVIDPLELFGDYHLTPTRGRIKTVNWNLKGAGFSDVFKGFHPLQGHYPFTDPRVEPLR
jgi:hypothetical protein